MSDINVTQRNATRNQSTADYQKHKVFIFDNRFERGVYKNTTGATITLSEGMFVARSASIAGGLIPVDSTNFQDTIGVVALDDAAGISLANNATLNIVYCTKGTVDSTELVMPSGVTLDSIQTGDTKAFRDILELGGLHLDNTSSEMTKFDN